MALAQEIIIESTTSVCREVANVRNSSSSIVAQCHSEKARLSPRTILYPIQCLKILLRLRWHGEILLSARS